MILPPSPLYDWIQSHGVPLPQIQDLDRELISGRVLQQILDLPPSSHLWRRIAAELAPLGIVVTDACINAIQSGDPGLVCDILAELHNRSTTTDELIGILQASLHECLHIDQPFALQLLDHRINIQLSEYLRQGRPGVTEWLSVIVQSVDTICAAIGSQPLNLIYIFRLLSPALHCQTDSEICRLTARILALIAMKVLPTSISMMECAWQWVSGPSAGLAIIVDSWRLQPSLSYILLPMLECLVSHRISDVVRYLLPKVILDDAERYGFIHELFIASSPDHQASYLTEALIDYVFRDVVANIMNQASAEATVVSGLNLITELMASYYEELTHIDPEYSNSVLALLRQSCRTQAHIDVQMASIVNLSELLDLYMEKDPACDQPLSIRVFKSLIFIFMDRYDDVFLRHFILYNLCSIIEQHPLLPVDVLLAPLVKQIPLHPMTNKDVNLLVAISRHEQLSLRSGTLLMHALAKFCLQTPAQTARMASVPFCIALSRFQKHPQIQQYIQKLSIMAIRAVIENEDSSLDTDPTAVGLPTLALELIAKIIHLPYSSLKFQIHPLIVTAIDKYRKAHGYGHVGLETLDDYLTNESEFGLMDLLDIPPSEVLLQNDSAAVASSLDLKQKDLATNTSNDSGPTELPATGDSPSVLESSPKTRRASRAPATNSDKKRDQGEREHRVSEKRHTGPKSQPPISKTKPTQSRQVRDTATFVQEASGLSASKEGQQKPVTTSVSQAIVRTTAPVSTLHAELRKPAGTRRLAKKTIGSPTKNKIENEADSAVVESDHIEGLSSLLKQKDRLLREVFREYKGQRPSITKFNTFDLQTKADACMSIPDFIKFWEDISICPGYVSKTAISGIFRSSCSGELSSMLINYDEFAQAIWKTARHISHDIDQLQQDSNILSRTVFIFERIKESRDSMTKKSTSSESKQAVAPTKPPLGSRLHSSVKSKEDHIVEEVVTVMMGLLSEASWEKLDRKQLKAMLKPGKRPVVTFSVPSNDQKLNEDAEEKERKRQKRRKELAMQLAVKRQETAAREAARKAEMEEAKRKEEELKAAKKKASEQEKIAIRKRLEQYHKRKQEEEQQRKEIEEAKKQLELAERKKSIALFQKQKKEREELEQQIQAQKLAIEQNTIKNRIPSRQRKGSAASSMQAKTQEEPQSSSEGNQAAIPNDVQHEANANVMDWKSTERPSNKNEEKTIDATGVIKEEKINAG